MTDFQRRRLLAAGIAAPLSAAFTEARAAAWPERAITLIVPFAPGGIADLTARAAAEQMGASLGKPVVVQNRPSAGSIVASEVVARARPDGYTLLLLNNSNALSVGLFRKLPYDLTKAFAPIGSLAYFDIGLFAPAATRWTNLHDALAEARAKPGKLNVATIAVGSTQNLAARLFAMRAGVQFQVIPYPGTPAVVAALRSGEADLAFEVLAPMLPQVSAGAVKALAVATERRLPVLPAVPTVEQAGVADYRVASWNGLAAPAGTPAAVVERLNRALREAVAAPALRAKLAPLGLRLAAGSPAELQALLESEIQRWGAVIRAAGIKAE